MERLRTVQEIAPELEMKPSALWRLIREGQLPPGVVVRFGRTIRISERSLLEFIKNGGTEEIKEQDL